ncbi:VOC family protein [Symmachiella dynata]|uniref:VOC family protein n=1 Tax=Symmachiella dynata TaxID=2527995 RepID=UPI0030EF86CE|tara:strand:- start:46 stop:402 length:357 start_codon:yes stop_codon:yes gene_type:complete
MTSPTFKLLVIKSHRMQELQQFYETLGCEFVEEQHGRGPLHLAAEIGEAIFEIYPLPDETSPVDTTTRLGFSVPDLDGVVDKLKTGQSEIVTAVKETAWGKRAVVRDPDGRSVELYQQ